MVTDLTQGNVRRVLIRFTVPLLVSVAFQQLYTIADSVIVGHFLGVNPLAAVGASYPITMLFLAVANGASTGCSVIVSQLFGAKQIRKMKTAVSTALLSALAAAISLTVGGIFSSKWLLRVIETPAEIFADAAVYLNIYIGGLIFLFLYNSITGIFTALGDSRTPLYFLIFSSAVNIALDLLFVAVLPFGVAGAAWATFTAQGFACIASLLVLLRRLKALRSDKPAWFAVDMLRRILRIAVPSILQQSFISVGNVLIQGLINRCGAVTVAAFAAAMKLNTFAITTLCALGNGISGYTAQNIGAGSLQRVKQGFCTGLCIAFCIVTPFFVLFFCFPTQAMQIFIDGENAAVCASGAAFLKIVSPFYFLITAKLVIDGILRGAGAMGAFMTATFSDLILRVLFAFLLFSPLQELGIWISWPIGWTAATILSVSLYLSGVWKKRCA